MVFLLVLDRNIVSTVNMDCRLELKTIALHARNAEYNPKVCTFLREGTGDPSGLHSKDPEKFGGVNESEEYFVVFRPICTVWQLLLILSSVSLPKRLWALLYTAICRCHHAHKGA